MEAFCELTRPGVLFYNSRVGELLIFPKFKTVTFVIAPFFAIAPVFVMAPVFVIARPQAVAIHAAGLPGLPRRQAPRNDDPDCHDVWEAQWDDWPSAS